MKIVIVGANGQLGQDAREILGRKHQIWAGGTAEVDITRG